MRWDPAQYAQYAEERGRPFRELVERVQADTPRRVIDLGCGPGNLTTLLADKWPGARIEGLDSSPDMIEQARGLGNGRVHFEVGDITTWTPPADVDVVISNAALQWVTGYVELLAKWTSQLPSGSWLAWQVPGNFASPSHVLLRELAASPKWKAKVGDVLRHHAMRETSDYAVLLHDAGWSADVWETTYQHVLTGEDPVLEWMRGTGLRPVLQALEQNPSDGLGPADFERDYGALLRSAYPTGPQGTVLDFRRIFAVGHKP